MSGLEHGVVGENQTPYKQTGFNTQQIAMSQCFNSDCFLDAVHESVNTNAKYIPSGQADVSCSVYSSSKQHNFLKEKHWDR